NVFFVEEAERKLLLARVLLGEPRVRDRAQLGQDRGDLLAWDDAEDVALLLELVLRVAQVAPRLPLEREGLERDARLLAHLEEREAEVDVVRGALGRHLVEDREAVVEVAELAESPDELGVLLLGTDRVAERDPA